MPSGPSYGSGLPIESRLVSSLKSKATSALRALVRFWTSDVVEAGKFAKKQSDQCFAGPRTVLASDVVEAGKFVQDQNDQ